MAEKSQALYIPRGDGAQPKSFLSWMWQDQITNPAYIDGNWRIARAVGLFTVGIAVVRSTWGQILVPVF